MTEATRQSNPTPQTSTPSAAHGEDSGGRSPATPPRRKGLLSAVGRQEYLGVAIAIVVLIAVIGAVYPRFLQLDQQLSILGNAAYIGILACGMAFLLAMRELDLSVGSIFAVSALVCATLIQSGINPWLAAVLSLAAGAVLGLINALLIQVVGLPSIVATLATLALYRGFGLAFSEGRQVLGAPLDHSFTQIVGGSVLGVPFPGLVLIVVVVILTVVLRFTTFGYRVRAIGSNPEAATFSGIPVNRVRLQAFVLTGLLGGLAGVLSVGYLGSADPNTGTGYELQAIAAAVIGGTALAGGRATIVGAALGTILLGVVGTGLAYFRVPIQWNQFALGAVILLAVTLDSFVRGRRRAGSSRPGL
jgi:ribose transport system permease protein